MSVRTVALLLLAAAGPAGAELVTIRWDDAGRHEGTLAVAPGKFAEVCGPLRKAQAIRWRYQASGPVDFNVHYHAGSDVVYPERRGGAPKLDGVLAVPADQDYCWMWENKGTGPVEVRYGLAR